MTRAQMERAAQRYLLRTARRPAPTFWPPLRRPHRKPLWVPRRYALAITVVDSYGNSQATSTVTSLSKIANQPVKVGDLLLAYTQHATSGGLVNNGITDDLGNRYQRLDHDPTSINSERCQLFVCESQFAGTPTTTVTWSAGVGDCQLICLTLRGVDTYMPVEQFAFNKQATPPTTSNGVSCPDAGQTALTPQVDGCLIVCFSGDSGALRTSQYAAGTGFTMPFSQGNAASALAGAVEYKQQTTATAVRATYTVANSDETLTYTLVIRPGDAARQSRTYETSFPSVENPLRDGTNWLDGGTDGLDWANMSGESGGRCIGHQTGGTGTDAGAVVKSGTWGPDQYVEGTVFVDSIPGSSCAPELELRLRSDIRGHINRGYEIAVGVDTANPYLIIVRWNGEATSFDYLLNNGTVPGGVVTGDIFAAQIVGRDITVFKNGVSITTIDAEIGGMWSWHTGAPGLGANLENGAGACAGQNVNYGWTHFRAAEIVPPPPASARRRVVAPISVLDGWGE